MINYNEQLGYRYLDLEKGVRVGTLIQKEVTPEKVAATLAAYSRSAKSVTELLTERHDQGVSASDKCKLIIDGYGHGSVRGMGMISLFIEGISMLDAMTIFYEFPYQNGQERSTRYQVMKGVEDFYIPDMNPDIKKDFTSILEYWMSCYSSLQDITKYTLSNYFKIDRNNSQETRVLKSRTLDCIRFFIPLAKRTSIGIVINGTETSRLIKELTEGLPSVATGLKELLDFEGTSNLIRHTDTYPLPTKEIFELIKDLPYKKWNTSLGNKALSFIRNNGSPITTNYMRVLNSLMEDTVSNTFENKEVLYKVSKLISSYFNQYKDMGNLGRSSTINISGLTDVGSLKDYNRHRPLAKIVSLLHEESNIKSELDRPDINHLFALPEYLNIEEFSSLKGKYEDAFKKGYNKILEFLYKWESNIEASNLSKLTKLLLPQGHLTNFSYAGDYGEWLYIAGTRSRPGGHINYRLLTEDIIKLIEQEVPEFKSNITPVNPKSREEFLDRS